MSAKLRPPSAPRPTKPQLINQGREPPVYIYHLLDPRDVPGCLEFLRDRQALGLEVTVPVIAEACSLGNIDPQHLGGNAQVAAIEEAASCPLPPPGTTLVTVRADADSLGAMAVLSTRADCDGRLDGEAIARIAEIAAADKEASGPWPGPRPLTRPEDLLRPTSVVEAVCMDHTRSMAERVNIIEGWLSTGYVLGTDEIRARILRDAADALDHLDVQVAGGVAAVTGAHRLAMGIGYRYAPVVVATNPAFRWQGGPAHRKHTVARWNTAHPMDWDGMLSALREAEPGWGGSTSICGSPQGTGSGLDPEEVVRVVRDHI